MDKYVVELSCKEQKEIFGGGRFVLIDGIWVVVDSKYTF